MARIDGFMELFVFIEEKNSYEKAGTLSTIY